MTEESPLPARPPSFSQVEMTQWVLPGQANALGNAFGGQIMAWIDIAASVAAARHAGGVAVTASVERVDFLRPVKQGEVVILKARCTYVGRTSIEVEVLVEGELPGKHRYCATTAFTTFVAIDEDGRPRPVPRLRLDTLEEQRRFEAGAERMRARKALRIQRDGCEGTSA